MKSRPVTLIVDDQESFDYIKPMLEKILDQPRLIHCKNKQEAMEFIKSDQYADIIFADWELTEYSFMSSVRRDLENHNTPVIIMSPDTVLKKIMLNRVDTEGTIFLTKPFLEKGLIRQFNRVMEILERRRKSRIHPAFPVTLKVQFKGDQRYSLPLVDLSIDGCLFCMPIESSCKIRIYQHAQISLTIDEFNMQIDGEIYRIGQDRNNLDAKDTVLVMIKFGDLEQQDRELQELVDELGKRW